ncbi:MAG: asparagine synthase (glutamine-hydrolyzing) [Deltaproteobacteria bacterium]|nr:asparagine synthase (glutamine-hydrolyzing) [Deltaproteobacteria bacterium]
MCGIAGIITSERINEDNLAAMIAALKHRGPDDCGSKIITGQGRVAALGHTRLSIIDLSRAARQPMANEDSSVWLTFNGEIYNFRALRSELEERGHRFTSQTDSEVLLHGYEEYGTDIFKRLNGMLACALWDSNSQTLIMGRDRYGQKPLYYWHQDGTFIFASELKALLRHPAVAPDIDPAALSRYLLFEYVPAPYCLIRNVHKLEPGCFLVHSADGIKIERYWDISFNDDPSIGDEITAGERLEQELEAAVKRHLESDVPLGVFLSGGVDSSVIIAMMSRMMPAEKIRTFCIGFKEGSFDESSYARKVAEHFGTDHHEQILDADKMIEILPEIWHLMDEPLADASIIPTHLLSRFTREYVTVALGGDGGDELFCGYDPFLAHKLAPSFKYIPGWLHRGVLEPLSRRLPVSDRNMSLDFRLKQTIKGLPYPLPVRNQVWLGAFSLEEQKHLFSMDFLRDAQKCDPYAEIMATDRAGSFRDQCDQLIWHYSKYYLSGDILTKVDRASMACSLEVRAPFLDAEFAGFANSLPSDLKMKGFTRKYLLKKVMKKYLPSQILNRPKKGFGIPLSAWLKNELKPLMLETLKDDTGAFRPETLKCLADDHLTGRCDNRKQIWTLLTYILWKHSLSKHLRS